jgi:hypothetical protein
VVGGDHDRDQRVVQGFINVGHMLGVLGEPIAGGDNNADPDYSQLLESLAGTPAERQAILRGYFEPTEEEREEGEKAPTPAHRAIARLRGSKSPIAVPAI